jgi:hypothetical protein
MSVSKKMFRIIKSFAKLKRTLFFCSFSIQIEKTINTEIFLNLSIEKILYQFFQFQIWKNWYKNFYGLYSVKRDT